MRKNILLIGYFDREYLNFLLKKYTNYNIHYWHISKEDFKVDDINYHKFNDLKDETIINFLNNFQIFYDLVLVSSLDYWDNIRIIRNIPKNLSTNGILIFNDIIHTDEYYLREIKLYGHNFLYDSIEFIKKSKLLFSNIVPLFNNLISSNHPSSIMLLRKK